MCLAKYFKFCDVAADTGAAGFKGKIMGWGLGLACRAGRWLTCGRK